MAKYSSLVYTKTCNEKAFTCQQRRKHNIMLVRADSRFAPSQWETALQSNTVSHWLGASPVSCPLMSTNFDNQLVTNWVNNTKLYHGKKTCKEKSSTTTLACFTYFLIQYIWWHDKLSTVWYLTVNHSGSIELVGPGSNTVSGGSFQCHRCLLSPEPGMGFWEVWDKLWRIFQIIKLMG